MYVLNVSVCVLLGVCVCCSVCVKTRGQSKAVCLRFLFVFLLFGVCVHFYVLSLACLPEVQNESLPYCSLPCFFLSSVAWSSLFQLSWLGSKSPIYACLSPPNPEAWVADVNLHTSCASVLGSKSYLYNMRFTHWAISTALPTEPSPQLYPLGHLYSSTHWAISPALPSILRLGLL